jgi:hypothetical protein
MKKKKMKKENTFYILKNINYFYFIIKIILYVKMKILYFFFINIRYFTINNK